MSASAISRARWTQIRVNKVRRRLLGLVVAVLTASGCASTARDSLQLPSMPDWAARQAALSEIRDWDFKGRIAVKTGDDGFNARFDWQQRGERFRATVSGPMGIGTVRIDGSPRRIVLTDKDGEKAVLTDPEAELQYRYGWTLPVTSLRFWALGIPDPATPSELTQNTAGQLETVRQSGWEVTVPRYREAAGQPMPRNIVATSEMNGVATRVRMVIDRWAFYAL